MTTEKQKRQLSLESIYLILQSAPRSGSDKDEPEGARYIKISDTLVSKMIETIDAYVEEGAEYLINDKNRYQLWAHEGWADFWVATEKDIADNRVVLMVKDILPNKIPFKNEPPWYTIDELTDFIERVNAD